ncbi:hypothetical protein [Roseateles toxinivorans]|uniref:Energy-coupling factor transport system substrate-specific component n=1 Tax=Roseateles toxinivorans TaxID=270368 RepID=A0A4R6QMS9_9BURK|nr:hypothetical protein [Roseateles toxinivorans]TDP64198.1 hypothetical protein DES47_104487 [Roseateles toxinivorans]
MPASVFDGPFVAHLILAVSALAVALGLRPWAALGGDGPPWPWLFLAALLPLFWGVDRYAVPVAQPLSGAALLVLFAGWPLAVLAMLPAALITCLAGDLSVAEALHRLIWLGIVPASLTLAIGALLRRYLPHHLFIYILGRGFFGTFAAYALTSAADIGLHAALQGTLPADLMIARVLNAFAEAFLTGMCVAIAVAYRPQWLATYSDRLYLPAKSS